MRAKFVILAMSLFAAAGCGGGESAPSAANPVESPSVAATEPSAAPSATEPSAAPSTTTKAPAQPGSKGDYTTNAEILTVLEGAGLECAGYKQQQSAAASEDGVCKLEGQTLALVIYPSREVQQQVRSAVTAFDSGYLIEGGDAWTVAVIGGSQALADQVHDALGGEISQF